ncbi:MAG: DUF6788 family protein [Planctomycetota bacterium]|jgi:hypothetical protein
MAAMPDVPAEVAAAARALADLRPMRREAVSERRMKCGQPTCACHKDASQRHGPYFTMNRVVAGKTRSRYLMPAEAELARQQAAAGQEFRRRVEKAWEAGEQWANAQLETPEAASQEAAKKGASKRRSKARSSPRSKRS